MYGGQSTYIPLKVNQAGVIPIIFASSVLYLPLIITNVLPTGGWGDSVRRWVDKQPRRRPDRQLRLGLRARSSASSSSASPTSTRRSPSTPSARPTRSASRVGSSPASARDRRPSATWPRCCRGITLPGALFIAVIAVLPVIMLTAFDVRNFPFAGTTDADRRRRRPRDDEADRQPADDAQLRGLPEVGGRPGPAVFAGRLGFRHHSAMIPGARLVLLGRQGAGKGTQCVRLARHYVVPHISTGDMLRMAVQGGHRLRPEGQGVHGRRRAAARRRDGRHRRTSASPARTPRNRGYILDGFPRTVGQAEALRQITTAVGKPLDLVLDLEVPEDVVVAANLQAPGVRRLRHQLLGRLAAPLRLDLRQLRRRGRPARRRHRGGDPPPPRALRPADRAAHRLVPGAATCLPPSTASATPTRSPAGSSGPSTAALAVTRPETSRLGRVAFAHVQDVGCGGAEAAGGAEEDARCGAGGGRDACRDPQGDPARGHHGGARPDRP